MKITVSELYGRCEELASIFGLSVNEDNRFVFDLHDDTSLESIKNAFGGIEKVLKPANGRYMVLMVLNEKPTNLMAVFPETEDGDMKAELFDVVDKKSLDIFKGVDSKDYDMITIENFSDVLDDEVEKERVETKINDFMFDDEKKEDEAEAEDEVKDDEDEVKDDEDKSKDGEDKSEDDVEDKAEIEDEEIDVVDGEEPEDGGLAGASLADDEDVDFTVVDDEVDDEDDEVVAESTVAESTVTEAEGDVPAAPAAPADTAAPEEMGEEPAATIEDPTKNIRDLIKYYTDRLNSAANSETTSTDTVSALQDVIASLVNNLETISELKDVETEEAKAAAKNAKAAEKGEEPVSEDGVPAAECPGPDCPPAKLQMDTETIVGDPIDSPHAASMQASVADLDVAPAAAAPELTTPFSDDLGADYPASAGDLDVVGPDGLPSGDEVPSDDFINTQIAMLGPASDDTVATFGDNAASDNCVCFAPGRNAVNWSDHLYDRGQANYIDNDNTVPAVLQELKEYATKARAAVAECGGVNETTIGRLNKFCNLCATAYDTWHKLQDSINGSYELCEAFGCHEGRGIDARNAESVQPLMESVDREQEKLNMAELKDSAAEFNAVQEYLKSITKFL